MYRVADPERSRAFYQEALGVLPYWSLLLRS
jgi:catechol 2,3-dioxygenase-like lactoylglutathione lyase family enzyme